MLDELKEVNFYIHKKIEEYKKNELEILNELEKDALEKSVPIISKDIREYLAFLIRTNKNIRNILEVGTATGYSGIVMAKEIQEREGALTTIEIDEERFNKAKKSFENSNLKRVRQILGDATLEIKKLEDSPENKFDFIFIDAAKGQYKTFFEDSYKLLNNDGIIFIDNILFRGYMYKEYPKKYKTIVRRLNEFIDFLYKNYDFSLLPISDGVGLVYKK